jgi:mannitol-1-phosphate 5-dehydrogenase
MMRLWQNLPVVIDRTPFTERYVPEIKGINWVSDIAPYIERKLFTVNTGHAAAAYHGHHHHKATVYEALQKPVILNEVKDVLAETSDLIVSK